ncbi:MAG: hypothetical protein HFH13_05455 [Dorea sp.]|jgi:hypothetical protein|nr:hypothetical protein [Dorea sp.]
MELDYFKDKIFDMLNDTNAILISDIEILDRQNVFKILLQDGNLFEVECRQIK